MPGFHVPGGGVARVDAPSSIHETARRSRWKLEIQGYGEGGIGTEGLDPAPITIYAHKATRPSPEIDYITVHHSQDEIYFPGKNRWAPIEISFYEVVTEEGNITARYIYEWWSKDILQLNKSRLAGISDRRLSKRWCYLTQLDGAGNGIYKYTLLGCWIEKVTPEDLNYEESTICKITVRLRFDKAIEESLKTNFDALTVS
jgi:hypothetical protein